MYDFHSPKQKTAIGSQETEPRPSNIIQIGQNLLETRLDRLVAEKVAELLNAMLDAEADEIANAAKYERTGERKAYRAGHYDRSLTAKAGRLALKVPKLKGAVFESAVIERYRRREESVEEALIDMYLAGVSTRQGRHQPIAVGRQDAVPDPERQAQEGVRGDRGVAHEAVGGRVPVRVHGRRVAQAFMGRLGRERQCPGRHRSQRGGAPRGDRRGRGHEGGQGQLGAVRPLHDRTRPEGRAPGGRRPVRRTRRHGRLDAAQGEIPAVHGAFHAQRALEDAADTPRMGVRRPQGHIRHGIPGIRPGQGRTGRHGDGIQEAQGRRELPARGRRRDDDLPAGRVPGRAPQEDPHEQHDRAAGQGDPPAHARGGRLPRREQRVDAHMRPHPSRHRERMVDPPLSRHVPAR